MAIIKCKMCGGDLILEEGSNVAECEYCGSRQTVPSADNEKKLNLFARANRLRANNEFDKAAGVYESIVADFPEEAEAYWGLILCKYGIEYVDDPATRKKIPTCHRSSFDSVMDDPNFELVMENADAIARRVYREEAKQLEELRKGIIEVSSKEEPYDIFICYKETDEKGDRTLDSVLSQDVYDMLTENGYRVFFSRVTLEDKLGVEYEPYIFAALNSAKIMLAFGTDYDYYNAVWVKNEWSRFLQLIAKGEKKTLIPCYKNIDAYDMPKEFAKLQAQDLGKVGAMQDLLRGIKKILPKEQPRADGHQADVEQIVQTGSIVAPLLKRAFMFLEDSEWEKADSLCEQVLNLDPENAEAYLGKLMAEMHVRHHEELRDCAQPFDESNNYQKCVRFSGENLGPVLKEYVTYIKDRNETKRKTDIYDRAISTMQLAKAEGKYKSAAKSFQSIPGFQDADALAKQCLEKAAECRRISEEKAAAVVVALKAGPRSKNKMTFEENLATSKARITSLEKLRSGFDALLAQAIQLQKEQAMVVAQETTLSAQLSAFTTQEANLSAHRAKLGIFAGKEKKRIDEELSEITAKKQESAAAISSLAEKKRVLTERIKQNTKQCCGFKSIAEIEREMAKENAAVSELEAQIESTRCKAEISFHYEEALKVYLSEPDVSYKVNSVLYPAISRDSIIFGKYIQKKAGSPEPIEWQVLLRENGRMLVISKFALDSQPYNTDTTSVTWGTSSLRQWLNGPFLNTAFSAELQRMIVSSKVTASNNPKYSTSPGRSITDKVFLLSIEEANNYFPADSSRQCLASAYYFTKEANKPNKSKCWWWLRSPGSNSYNAAFVNVDGTVNYGGHSVGKDITRAVRPALWINLEL